MAEAGDDRDHDEEAARFGATRREFLKLGGVAGAAAVVAGGGAAAVGAAAGHSTGLSEGAAGFAALPAPPTPRSKPGFDHLVVVMGENRSFDNLLGWLYDADTVPDGTTFDGLAFGDYANTAPDGEVVAAHVYAGATDLIMSRPHPDPGEEYPHVNTQLFGTIRPASNATAAIDDMTAPYNAPDAGAAASMSGFLTDYAHHVEHDVDVAGHRDLRQIMGSFSPEMLPVLSTLAKGFAVYDAWHCAVPSQTFCNRSFFHASTSHGFVTNRGGAGYRKWLEAKPAPTIFNRLEDAGLDWRIYFDDLQLVSMTGIIHAPALEKYWRTEHFAPMSQFWSDVADGKLPPYSFVEPRMIYDHNDFHPPVGPLRESEVEGGEVTDSAISDVRAGELLIHRIYSAIRESATEGGSNAVNTMLLITFDEHGGTYDHVAPPAGTPPHPDAKPGEMGFAFDRLGCRVPAIAISAYTAEGGVIHDAMHHGSVIATLCKLHRLDPLTARDDGAPDILNAVTRDTPRHPLSWPVTTPQYTPPNPEAEPPHPGDAHRAAPLSPPARGLLGMLIAKYGADGEPEPETYGDAYEALQKYGVGLFGAPR
ncbi:alkaline phosphatase family protein [Agromyces aurantiacus]|uniref:phospholipase C n=1 Tax=Agromyces aurantiacus TaxID=165814 RepID=A0ABV9RD37_9MICO|nr:alkaline phosphatase family protein [Agromyces aurantiacus]MBM7505010.1 phospholipase C [Agromyces aurantiacus]